MKIWILVPTFREISHVSNLLLCLQRQTYHNYHVVIINCNPFDETTKLIAKEKNVKITELHGHSELFWTGAIELGMNWLKNNLVVNDKNDAVLLLNCDNTFDNAFLTNLKRDYSSNRFLHATTLSNGFAVVSGVKVRSWALCINRAIKSNFGSVQDADMLNGRALLFPVKALIEVGTVNSLDFPHYCADLEYTCRAKKFGYDLYVTSNATVINDRSNSGIHRQNTSKPISYVELCTSKKSPTNLVTRLKFVKSVYPKKTLYISFAFQTLKVLVDALRYYLTLRTRNS